MKNLLQKDGTRKVLASLISIAAGLLVGAIVVVIIGFTKKEIGVSGIWDGVRLILVGLLSIIFKSLRF